MNRLSTERRAQVIALWRNGVDYAALIKEYGNPAPEDPRRYSPAVCTAIDVRVITGKPTIPAMAAGIERAPWSFTQIAELLEASPDA